MAPGQPAATQLPAAGQLIASIVCTVTGLSVLQVVPPSLVAAIIPLVPPAKHDVEVGQVMLAN